MSPIEKMDAVVISLVSSKDRRNSLKERLEFGGIKEFQIFDAVDKAEEPYEFGSWKHDPRLKNMAMNRARIYCYLSHLRVLKAAGANPVLIMEDDILFTKENVVPLSLKQLPPDAELAFWDCTLIEERDETKRTNWKKVRSEKWNPTGKSGWVRIDVKKFRVWCTAAYYVKDASKAYEILMEKQSKVYDKCLIDYFQKDKPCYLWLPQAAIQDRVSFNSSIKIEKS